MPNPQPAPPSQPAQQQPHKDLRGSLDFAALVQLIAWLLEKLTAEAQKTGGAAAVGCDECAYCCLFDSLNIAQRQAALLCDECHGKAAEQKK